MKITITYTLDDVTDILEIDKKIRKGLELAGLKWYAQGINNQQTRDLCFDLELDEKLAAQ